ncbi:MAG: hypothetical protein ABMA00_18795, partial [Gemmatimonas sp.]
LLADADAIKFAHHAVSTVRARTLHDEARALVQDIEAAEQEQRKRDAAAKQAADRSDKDIERAARRAAEDDARRRARRPKAGAR